MSVILNPGLGDALTTNPLSQFAATTSAQLAGVISDEMAGTGTKLAFGTSGVEAAYGGTITWTAVSAPSGTANLRQFYTQVGNCVMFQISMTYAVAGATVTNVTLTFPTEFPTPAIPTGFTGANAKLYTLVGRDLLSPTGTAAATQPIISRNAADTGFEITHNAFTSAAARGFLISGSYFTQ